MSRPSLSFGSNHVDFGGMIAPASDTAIRSCTLTGSRKFTIAHCCGVNWLPSGNVTASANVRAGRRMILIKGSGRAADALVSLLEKAQVSDPEIAALRESAQKAMLTRRPQLFQIVALQGGSGGLRDAITAAIRRP